MDQPSEDTPAEPAVTPADPDGPDQIQERLWGLGESPLGFHGKRPLRPATIPVRPRPPADIAAEELEAIQSQHTEAIGRLDGHVQSLARQLERSVRRLLNLEAWVAESLTGLEHRAEQAAATGLEPLEDALSSQVAALGESLAGANAALAARIATLEQALDGAGGLADRVGDLDRSGGVEASLAAAERLEDVGRILMEAEARLSDLAASRPPAEIPDTGALERRLADLERIHAALAASMERDGRELANRLTRRLEDVRDDLAVQIADARRLAAAALERGGGPDPALVERLRVAEDAFAARARSVAQALTPPPGATGEPRGGNAPDAFREAVQDLLRLHRDVRRSLESLGAPAPEDPV